ncbi:malonyl-CoA O-methyltransferase [Steroidobacter denitrificans]|uniref:Malonyl-[acyl-carrier protein] O-methyltransferase n=1 Tax=Steroidobacter denitrificans TaxID=465721 RepID=A0A127FEV3_STEDE|nr:malonyl-ACP O-methyltransferase BioC [Steroidobacter denitrificans]AMN48441.1 malonyl-CoA O-methyltransferase [Steroidobacter denitrificans]
MNLRFDEYFLDPRVVRRSFDKASRGYDTAAVVAREIDARLLERLDVVRMQPARILDLGAGTGQASRALKQRYRAAQVIALDLSPAMLRASRRRQGLRRRFQRAAADAHRLPIRTGSIDLVFSNLMLQWCHDPDTVFQEVRRVLKPQGLFIFTTLGPDTLMELRRAWRTVDDHIHVHRFIDMHDLGDALMRARFADPVMDMERLSVTYPDLDTLLRDLQACGARNIAQGRLRGLTGRARFQAVRAHEALALREGVLPVSVELVYGQAWAGEPRPKRQAEPEFRIPIQAIGRRGRHD